MTTIGVGLIGNIEAWENNDNAIGGIPYHLLNYDNSNYVYDTMEIIPDLAQVSQINYDTVPAMVLFIPMEMVKFMTMIMYTKQ